MPRLIAIVKQLKTWLILSLMLCFLALAGCEDDPVLSPDEDGQSDNGSYGSMQLSVEGETPADSSDRVKNPKVF